MRRPLLAALLLAACAHAPSPRPAPTAMLVVHTAPDAIVSLDDAPLDRGAALATPTAVPAGAHRLEIRADGRLTAYRDLTLRAGDHAVVDAPLDPDLDARDAAPLVDAPPTRPAP